MNKTHRETYPEQYEHPLVGRTVVVKTPQGGGTTGVVSRVMGTQWGPLVELEHQAAEGIAWSIKHCTPLDDTHPRDTCATFAYTRTPCDKCV